jgi:hypothetical protein
LLPARGVSVACAAACVAGPLKLSLALASVGDCNRDCSSVVASPVIDRGVKNLESVCCLSCCVGFDDDGFDDDGFEDGAMVEKR